MCLTPAVRWLIQFGFTAFPAALLSGISGVNHSTKDNYPDLYQGDSAQNT